MEIRTLGLVHIKQRITLPCAIDFKFPPHARDGGADETVIDLLLDGASGLVEISPARFEVNELCLVLANGVRSPVGSPVRRPV